MSLPVLEVQNLHVHFQTSRGPVKAVDGVSFALGAGERYGLIGESGSGKTTIALAIMRLITPPGRIVKGSVLLDGVDLFGLPDEEMRQRRLADVALVTQGAMNALNPVIRVREQIVDGLRSHGVKMSRDEVEAHIAGLLPRVGLRPEVANMYPHELSGGMKQRVSIAIAISLRPRLIIADEPTCALDVVVQRQVMQTLRKVQEDLGAAVILIGHDMGLMAQFADRMGVIYAGKLVEEGMVAPFFAAPQHPYSQLLVSSVTTLEKKGEFHGVRGAPPSLLDLPSGCAFHPRCTYAMPRCKTEAPLLHTLRSGYRASCHLLEEDDRLPARDARDEEEVKA
ncbi:MAG TPA: ABC transporter ATP-binding protein [Candidatus Binatia bacterium]|nr:ABC transporter ATP-binding protein [Candidatus Binatia bacterium]